MQALRKVKRSQRLLLVLGLSLALYAVLVYRPLSTHEARLDRQLVTVWNDLAKVDLAPGGVVRTDLAMIEQTLGEVRQSKAILQEAEQAIEARLDAGPDLVRRVTEPFRLIEFRNESLKVIEELWRIGLQKKVTLDAEIINGFPEYKVDSIDRADPALLWAQLNLLQHSLLGAVQCGVSRIKSVASPPVEFHRVPGNAFESLVEVPIQIEIVGSAVGITRFLEFLPLRGQEAQPRGLPAVAPDKPAFFIDRILLRKESKERLDEVSLQARLCSFLYYRRD